MVIKGIENITNYEYAQSILLFILDTYEDSDELNITEEDYNIFCINGKKYVIYCRTEIKKVIDNHNEILLEDFLSDIPEKARPYIDINKWTDDFGADDILEVFESEYGKIINYMKCVNNHFIYELTDE